MCDIITFTIYIAFVEKWDSFPFLRRTSKDRENNQYKYEIIWRIFLSKLSDNYHITPG